MGKAEEVRDAIISEGIKGAENVIEKSERLGVFFGNLTKNLEDSSKGAVTVHSGKRAATTGFKATKDFNRGDPVCGTLCTISSSCEVVSGVLVWVPFPGKICTVSCLKAVSIGCEKIRDMCAADPSSPMC